MRSMACTVALLVFVAFAEAASEDVATPEEIAEQVLGLFEQDHTALAALAAKSDPDPWQVAEALCARGRHDAAAAFSKAAPRPDVARLPECVATWRNSPIPTAIREAIASAREALRREDGNGALSDLQAVGDGADAFVAAEAAFLRGQALLALRRWTESHASFLASAKASERAGWHARTAASLQEAGAAAYLGAEWRAAQDAWQRCLALQEQREDQAGIAKALFNLGNVQSRQGAHDLAIATHDRALDLMEEAGDRAGVAKTLNAIGATHWRRGDLDQALDRFERSLEIMESLGDEASVAMTLGNIGLVHLRRGAYEDSLAYQERALALNERLGNTDGVARALVNLGIVLSGLGAYERSLEVQERALAMKRELGDRPGVALSLTSLGNLAQELGRYDEALAYHEEALASSEAMGDREAVARTLGNLGVVQRRMGRYAEALDLQERSLELSEAIGDRRAIAIALGNLGVLHRVLGNPKEALGYQERALALKREIGDRRGEALTLGNIGNIHQNLGDDAAALRLHERALAISQDLGDREGEARALDNIADLQDGMGERAAAVATQQKALAIHRAIGNRYGEAIALGNLGAIQRRGGDLAKALESSKHALDLALEIGSAEIEAQSLVMLADLHLARGEPAEAVARAREAIDRFPLLVGRLGEEQSAQARERWARVFEVGLAAARKLEDPGEVLYFLESGRAIALLESLGGGEALRRAVVPPDLASEERDARAQLTEVQARLQRAQTVGKLEEIREARKLVESSEARVLTLVDRIRRRSKAVADVAYPQAAPLEEIRAVLAPQDALVEYAYLPDEVLALVLTRTDARIVSLGTPATIEAVVEELDLARAGSDPGPRLTQLSATVVAPLGLPPGARRLLISPGGILSFVPFSLLVSGRQVVYVPSGTTLAALRELEEKGGEGVLALGDPRYDAAPARASVYHAGALAPLPQTREEVEAIAEAQLLGEHATEERLVEALAGSERWRAVHLACHGLVNPQQPRLSSLALTPTERSDGFLTVLEVCSSKIPADLVVLSACETAKGRIYRGEGIVGFARAFMVAGASRVLVSLWKVDDAATRALMVRFYELWTPGNLSAEAALEQAQAYVASQESWEHPHYWAAWQLWGLPGREGPAQETSSPPK